MISFMFWISTLGVPCQSPDEGEEVPISAEACLPEALPVCFLGSRPVEPGFSAIIDYGDALSQQSKCKGVLEQLLVWLVGQEAREIMVVDEHSETADQLWA